MTYTRAQQVLFALIANALFDQPLPSLDEVDWREVYAESRAQAVTLSAFQNYKALPLDGEFRQWLEALLQKQTLRNVQNFQHHGYLHRLLTKAEIPYCVLKGISSAHYYRSPLSRGMGDVDFYVAPADLEKTAEALLADGFTADPRPQVHHRVYRKAGMHFELHYEVAGVPNGRAGEIVGEYLSDLTRNSTPTFDEFVTYQGPNPFHHGLILLLHMQHHLLSEGIGLRHLSDWAVFVHSFSSDEFVRLFAEKLRHAGLWVFAQTVSLAAALHMGLPRQAWMGEDDVLAEELLQDILAGGNFGRKDHARPYEGMLISNRGKDGVGKNRIVQGFSSLNRIVRSQWPVTAKCPLLYPIGWIYFPLRYFFRVLTGKRKSLNALQAYENSGKRQELYSRLQLYKIDEESSL